MYLRHSRKVVQRQQHSANWCVWCVCACVRAYDVCMYDVCMCMQRDGSAKQSRQPGKAQSGSHNIINFVSEAETNGFSSHPKKNTIHTTANSHKKQRSCEITCDFGVARFHLLEVLGGQPRLEQVHLFCRCNVLFVE